jgi:hypothetical protein
MGRSSVSGLEKLYTRRRPAKRVEHSSPTGVAAGLFSMNAIGLHTGSICMPSFPAQRYIAGKFSATELQKNIDTLRMRG